MTRTNERGRGIIPPPLGGKVRKGFYLAIQVSLFRDIRGLELFIRFGLLKIFFQREWLLRKDPKWNEGNSALTPKMPFPEMLAEVPIVKQVEPEDMMAEPLEAKLIEPEDM